jgi:hypothetical protein
MAGRMSEEGARKIAEANRRRTGWKHTPEARARISASRRGADNPNWGGDQISYAGAHLRVNRLRGQPKECEHCGTTDADIYYDWANLTGNYTDPEDYIRLCAKCHFWFDSARGGSRWPFLSTRREQD